MLKTAQQHLRIKKLLAYTAGVLFFLPFIAFGQAADVTSKGNYEPLIFLPEVGRAESIGALLQGLFQLSIALGAVLAVIMIAVGGIQYIGSDAISSKSAGRERMFNAVLGLVLILGTYILLYTINPRLLSFQIFSHTDINTVTTRGSAPGATAPTGGTPGHPATPAPPVGGTGGSAPRN